jgi:hypothetical protein
MKMDRVGFEPTISAMLAQSNWLQQKKKERAMFCGSQIYVLYSGVLEKEIMH